jgi:hypothetical protein
MASILVMNSMNGLACTGASSSDTGINLIACARLPMGHVVPFGQAQFTVGDLNLLTIGAGVLILLNF